MLNYQRVQFQSLPHLWRLLWTLWSTHKEIWTKTLILNCSPILRNRHHSTSPNQANWRSWKKTGRLNHVLKIFIFLRVAGIHELTSSMVMVAAFPFQHRVEPRPNFYRISQDVNNLKVPEFHAVYPCLSGIFSHIFVKHLDLNTFYTIFGDFSSSHATFSCHSACQRFFTLQLGIPAVDLWLWPLTEKIRKRHQDYAILLPSMSRNVQKHSINDLLLSDLDRFGMGSILISDIL